MKKVLLLTYYFPPRNRTSSFRPGYFAKYLPTQGWNPTVICEDWPQDAKDHDPSFLSDIPEEVEVHRIDSAKPKGLYRFYVRNIAPYLKVEKTPLHWWKKARLKAFELNSRQKFDAIWATHDPLATLTLAAELSSKYRTPWVADLRDSWNVQKIGPRHKRQRIAKHEQRLCRMADEVVTVSHGLAAALESCLQRKVSAITNGFDPTAYPVHCPPSHKTFTLLYAGNISKARNPSTVLEAIERCITHKLIPKEQFKLCFLGSSPKDFAKLKLKSFPKVPFTVEKRLPIRDALCKQMEAAALLVLTHPNETGVLTGKVFDYLGAGRPILGVPDDGGEISTLLQSTGAGVCRSTVEEICQTLVKWYNQWKGDREFNLERNDREIAKHTRQHQARQLAEILNTLN